MEQIRGMAVGKVMKERMKKELETMSRPPVLAIVRVGERPDDISYEKSARKRMEGIGIETRSFVYGNEITNEDFLAAFDEINTSSEIDGILLLRPLPKQLDETEITKRICPHKDVDGISPVNLAKVFMDEADGFAPCTAEAVMEMLHYSGMELSGKRAVVAGRSLVVGKPLSMLLMKENCTVTICHSRTKQMRQICSEADILVAAVGKPRFFDGSYVKAGACVLDVGIHVTENGNLCGDVAAETLGEDTAWFTPVPGGVGTVTTFVLAEHVIRAAKMAGV